MQKILIVDDEPRIRDLFRQVLARQGYEMVFASNGNQALMAMEMCHPDLVLLDLAMPEMDGIKFLEVIRRTPEWARTPVIVLTAFVADGQRSAALALDIAHCLTKADFSVRELRQCVAQLLAPNSPSGASAPLPN